MAIVKFVSDKDCQIFLDKECVGEVTNDSMLKLTLEPGGYLVEVKDNEAHVLKKYNLEIRATDNQVLQDVSSEASSLDDVINQLKDDPSLEFHCDRASFCHNGLYGYVNKRFEVVIPPIYIFANTFKDDKTFVVREFPEGKKTTMIDSNGNMFFNRWFDYIGESDETILLGIDNRIIVYSKSKCDKIAEYYNAGYDFKHPYVPVFRKEGVDELYGFIDFEGKEVVKLLFDRVDNFDDMGYANVYFWGVKSIIDKNDFTLKDDGGYKFEINNFYDLVSIYNGAMFNEPLSLDEIDIYENNKWIFKTVHPLFIDDKWILRIVTNYQNDDTSHEVDIECDKIVFLGDRCFVYRIGKQCIVKYFDYEEDVIVNAEFIIPANRCVRAEGCAYDEYFPDTFITRKNGKYGTIDMNGKEILPTIYDSIKPIQPNYFIDIYTKLPVYAIIQRGVCYSLANLSEGRILLPFEYDEITQIHRGIYLKDTIFMLKRMNQSQLFSTDKETFTVEYNNIIVCERNYIVKKDDCYGIVDDYGREIVPLANNVITLIDEKDKLLDKKFFKIKYDNSYALGDVKTGAIITKQLYDEISVFSQGMYAWIFIVRKDGKYGCIDDSGKTLIPIKYDKIDIVSSKIDFSADNYRLRLDMNEEISYYDLTI